MKALPEKQESTSSCQAPCMHPPPLERKVGTQSCVQQDLNLSRAMLHVHLLFPQEKWEMENAFGFKKGLVC